MDRVRLLLADDHTLIRDGLKRIVQFDERIRLVGEAADGREAIELALGQAPDVILMDINMPAINGIEATRAIKKQRPEAAVIMLTIHDDPEYIDELFNLGVSGYVLKDISADELLEVIMRVAAGESFIDPRLSGKLIGEWQRRTKAYNTIEKLTEREREVLAGIASGESNKEIAGKLYISEKTVKNHLTNIFRKLNVSDRTQAALYAIKHKLVDL